MSFFSCLQFFPASSSFLISWLYVSGGQNIGASASVSSIQDLFPLGLTGLISLQSKGLSRVFSKSQLKGIQSWAFSLLFYGPILAFIHDYWKNHSLTIWTFVGKVMSLLFNTSSRFAIAFLIRSKHPLISWLQSPSAVILEPKKIACHCFHCFSICLPWSDGTGSMIFIFRMLSFKPAFSLSSFTFIKTLFSSSSLSAITVVSSAYLRLWIFLWQSWLQLVLLPAQRFSWCTLHIS